MKGITGFVALLAVTAVTAKPVPANHGREYLGLLVFCKEMLTTKL